MAYAGTVDPKEAANIILDDLWEQSKNDNNLHLKVCALLSSTSHVGYILQTELDELLAEVGSLHRN